MCEYFTAIPSALPYFILRWTDHSTIVANNQVLKWCLGPVTSTLLGARWVVSACDLCIAGLSTPSIRIKGHLSKPKWHSPSWFSLWKIRCSMQTDPNVHWGVCIVCCDERSICSYSQIGPCDGEICAGSLLIGSHYPPTQAQTLNQHQTQWNTHTHTHIHVPSHTYTHHCTPVCSPKQAKHLHIIREDNPVKRWMTDCWCLFSVMYGTMD